MLTQEQQNVLIELFEDQVFKFYKTITKEHWNNLTTRSKAELIQNTINYSLKLDKD